MFTIYSDIFVFLYFLLNTFPLDHSIAKSKIISTFKFLLLPGFHKLIVLYPRLIYKENIHYSLVLQVASPLMTFLLWECSKNLRKKFVCNLLLLSYGEDWRWSYLLWPEVTNSDTRYSAAPITFTCVSHLFSEMVGIGFIMKSFNMLYI
jgi:hypothetical protein